MSVGNIYRYYSSKDDIFYANVDEYFIQETKDLLKEKIAAAEGRDSLEESKQDGFWLVNEEVISFMVENRYRLIIVFKKSEGTKYEKAINELVEFILMEVRKSIDKQYADFGTGTPGGFTAGIIYKNLVDMVLDIMEESSDSETVRGCLREVNTYHMFGVTGLLTSKAKQFQN